MRTMLVLRVATGMGSGSGFALSETKSDGGRKPWAVPLDGNTAHDPSPSPLLTFLCEFCSDGGTFWFLLLFCLFFE